MSAPSISDKARELDELRALSALPAWKDRLLPAIAKKRDAHLAGCTAKHSTPEKRAEHIEAYHLAHDLLELVPIRIEALTADLVAHQQKSGAFVEPVSALTDPK